MTTQNSPLVSIRVITYNSSQYVKETLDSAYAQTYPNIEIIISDDCSTDNTVDICRQWVNQHKDSEKRIVLLESLKNTGVTGNVKRAFEACKGEWAKGIAGDDILAPTAIEDYIDFVTKHPGTRHLIAKAVHFKGDFQNSDLSKPDVISQYLFREKVTAKFQYDVIRKVFWGSGPTYFAKTSAIREVGGYDERFPMQEDYPLFIKMIGKGYKMMYLDKVTVYKRIVETSLQYDKSKDAIFTKNHVRMVVDYKYQYRKEVLSWIWRMLQNYSLWIQRKVIDSGNSYNSLASKRWYKIYKLTDPFVWYARWFEYRKKQYLIKDSI